MPTLKAVWSPKKKAPPPPRRDASRSRAEAPAEFGAEEARRPALPRGPSRLPWRPDDAGVRAPSLAPEDWQQASDGWVTEVRQDEGGAWMYKPREGVYFYGPDESLWKKSELTEALVQCG